MSVGPIRVELMEVNGRRLMPNSEAASKNNDNVSSPWILLKHASAQWKFGVCIGMSISYSKNNVWCTYSMLHTFYAAKQSFEKKEIPSWNAWTITNSLNHLEHKKVFYTDSYSRPYNQQFHSQPSRCHFLFLFSLRGLARLMFGLQTKTNR